MSLIWCLPRFNKVLARVSLSHLEMRWGFTSTRLSKVSSSFFYRLVKALRRVLPIWLSLGRDMLS